MSPNRDRNLFLNLRRLYSQNFKQSSSTINPNNRGELIINSKRQQYNFYSNDFYNKLTEIPLVSKGWNHSKSKGDYFIVRPVKEELVQQFYSFRETGIHPELIKCLKENGIKQATAFQAEAIPALRESDHAILAAETGCGKTITYLLPIIDSLIGQKTDLLNSPKAVIIVPNRELAYQVGDVAHKLVAPFDLKVKTVIGGRTKKLMLNPEFGDIDILIGTPGALGKLSTVGIFKLDQVMHTVLDEADTLLDDSFEERMTSLIKRVFQSRIILVSATLPKALPDVLKPIEQNLQQIISPRLHKPLTNITQKFFRIIKSAKPAHLLDIAKKNKDPMLVFTNKSPTCDWLAMYLREHGFTCANINGDMNYALRMEQWDEFISGKTQILSATDVGSRGLNTTQVRHVLNYDFPLYAADYLHRIGRTGRFGSPEFSMVTNFVTGPLEIKLVQQIELAIRKRQPLENVDGNITNLVQSRIMKRMKEVA